MLIYNTLSGQKDKFVSLVEGEIGMYVCGPTVYDKGHLGHARSMISFDMIRRYFEYKGYKVKFVTNFTDIDDKMINRANQEGVSVKELAGKIIPLYERDFDALKIKRPTVRPLATEYVPRMLEMIQKLLDIDVAYEIENDGIYFNVSKFEKYGDLSKQDLAELQHGARIAVKDLKKTSHDFVLWKYKKEGEPFWTDPTGEIKDGRPGWHIECSAMTYDLLGETFDIHAGGLDLTFPHHECEIAQSECYTGKPFAKYWMHNGFVNIDGEKMSKSLNNFQTIEDALKTYNPLALRYLLLSTHYRSPIDFTDAMLEQAVSARGRLQEFYERVRNVECKIEDGELEVDHNIIVKQMKKGDLPFEAPIVSEPNLKIDIKFYLKSFTDSMDDDFNVSAALASVFDLMRLSNIKLDKNRLSKVEKVQILEFLNIFNSIFQVIETEIIEFSDEVKNLISKRAQARESRDFKLSDELRDKLLALGVESKDSADGSTYRSV